MRPGEHVAEHHADPPPQGGRLPPRANQLGVRPRLVEGCRDSWGEGIELVVRAAELGQTARVGELPPAGRRGHTIHVPDRGLGIFADCGRHVEGAEKVREPGGTPGGDLAEDSLDKSTAAAKSLVHGALGDADARGNVVHREGDAATSDEAAFGGREDLGIE